MRGIARENYAKQKEIQDAEGETARHHPKA